MSDDFEARLRARLTDLADSTDGFADPLPEARRRAATADPDDAGEVRAATPVPGRRWWPGLAVAAVVLAVFVGGGLGLHALVRGGSGGASSGSAAVAAGGDAGQDTASGRAPAAPAAGTAGADGCAGGPASTSTGPLAAIASIRPTGTVAPATTAGGSVTVPYRVTFTASGGSAQVRPARVLQIVGGALCPTSGVASPGAVQVVPVAAGGGISGAATFTAVDPTGAPLPAGAYQVAVVISYTVDGSAVSQLTGPPVTVQVTS